MAGLKVVLIPTAAQSNSINLKDWLSDLDPALVWIPLKPEQGVIKVMPISTKLQSSDLWQAICQKLTQVIIVQWFAYSYQVGGIEVIMGELFAFQISLNSEQKLVPTLSRALHSLFMEWLSRGDPLLAQQVHQQALSPFTLARSFESKAINLRITLLGSKLLVPLLWGLNQDLGHQITITNIPCQIATEVKWLQNQTYEQLFNTQQQHLLTLDFITPTSFKQENYVQTFLLPELVFSSLHRRWNTFAPLPCQLPPMQWQGWVTAYELKTYAFKLQGGAEIGAQGWVRYQFPDLEQMRVASILAQFATFAGVGRKTAMGMGRTQLLLDHHKRPFYG